MSSVLKKSGAFVITVGAVIAGMSIQIPTPMPKLRIVGGVVFLLGWALYDTGILLETTSNTKRYLVGSVSQSRLRGPLQYYEVPFCSHRLRLFVAALGDMPWNRRRKQTFRRYVVISDRRSVRRYRVTFPTSVPAKVLCGRWSGVRANRIRNDAFGDAIGVAKKKLI
jgi:hypothetical protein